MPPRQTGQRAGVRASQGWQPLRMSSGSGMSAWSNPLACVISLEPLLVIERVADAVADRLRRHSPEGGEVDHAVAADTVLDGVVESLRDGVEPQRVAPLATVYVLQTL